MYGLIGGLLVLVILTIVIAGIINEKRWKTWRESRKETNPGVGNEPVGNPNETSGMTTIHDEGKQGNPLESRNKNLANDAQELSDVQRKLLADK
ncbi:uncharacterized protein LOC111099463 isoform X2 [Crassostrea virginica]